MKIGEKVVVNSVVLSGALVVVVVVVNSTCSVVGICVVVGTVDGTVVGSVVGTCVDSIVGAVAVERVFGGAITGLLSAKVAPFCRN